MYEDDEEDDDQKDQESPKYDPISMDLYRERLEDKINEEYIPAHFDPYYL